MFHRLALIVTVLALIISPRMATADPITPVTYDFTGSLSEPVDGSRTISGSLIFNATPTAAEVGTMPGSTEEAVGEGGSDVSLTVNLGGQVFSFQNNPQDPSSSVVGLAVNPVPEYSEVRGEPTLEFGLGGSINNQVTFVMTAYIAGFNAPPANLTSLDLPHQLNTFDFSISPTEGSAGTITSMEPVSTPEPGSLAIFAGLTIAALARRRCRKLSGRLSLARPGR